MFRSFLIGVVVLLRTALGHVDIAAPNGGETLQAGTTVMISWINTIPHVTQNWDLWYSTTGPNGPWIPIVMDLPPGNLGPMAIHTYAWIVPSTLSTQVRIRVRQDNSGTDYEDVSDGNLAILASMLTGTPSALSLAVAGTQTLTLNAGTADAGFSYVASGSVSGRSPGISLSTNGLFIELNPDWYFSFLLSGQSANLLSNQSGTLNSQGQATLIFTLPTGLPMTLSGLTVYHAVVVGNGLGVPAKATNPVPLLLNP